MSQNYPANYNKDTLEEPEFFRFFVSTDEYQLSKIYYANANFYRHSLNTNIELTVPIGTVSSGIWTSPNIFLNINAFNSILENDSMEFVVNRDINILKDGDFMHDLLIQYKLTKSDNNNYVNAREMRTSLVKADGITEYDPALIFNNMPDTGVHDFVLINGTTSNLEDDLIKIKMNIIQNETLSGQTATKITIFRISWNITSNIIIDNPYFI
ncbi:MAG: hypothetical protein ACRCZI_08425 [Cetobacterium sp.]